MPELIGSTVTHWLVNKIRTLFELFSVVDKNEAGNNLELVRAFCVEFEKCVPFVRNVRGLKINGRRR